MELSPSQLLIQCNLAGVNVNALIDTGSMKSFLCRGVFDKILPKPPLAPCESNCIGITGKPLSIDGSAQARLSFPNCSSSLSYLGTFIVSPNLLPSLECIIGWDFITSNALQLKQHANGNYFMEGPYGCTPLHPYASHISLSPNASGSPLNDSVPPPNHYPCLLVQSAHRSPVPVPLSDNICVPSRSEVLVSCKVHSSSREQLGMVSPISDNLTLPSNILAAYSVCQVQGWTLPVRIMNTSNVDIELHAGQKVSEFCPVIDTPDTYECMASATELSSPPNNLSLSVIKQ